MTVREVEPILAERGRERIEQSLARAVHSGKLTEDEREAVLSRLAFTTDLGEMADRQLVIEAVVESEPAKIEVFSVLDKVIEAPDAILASNTSSIPIMKLAMATQRPAAVIGMHFFNPVPVHAPRRDGDLAADLARDAGPQPTTSPPTSSTSGSSTPRTGPGSS